MKIIIDAGNARAYGLLRRFHEQTRALGCFIWRRYSGEGTDFSGVRHCIEPLGISLRADLHGCGKIGFDEPLRSHYFAGHHTIFVHRRNERCDNDEASVIHQLCNVSDSPDVFASVLGTKTKISRQAMSDVVAVQDIARVSCTDQSVFKLIRKSGFARTGQTGKPDGSGLLSQHRGAFDVVNSSADTPQISLSLLSHVKIGRRIECSLRAASALWPITKKGLTSIRSLH